MLPSELAIVAIIKGKIHTCFSINIATKYGSEDNGIILEATKHQMNNRR
jgi:hypothetical protein